MFGVLFISWIYHRELLSSWRLLFTLHEICDKEYIKQLSPEGVNAKNNIMPQ